MIKVKSLTFNNIGRFVEEQTVSFENLQKLTQFDGKNLNTGGSSGSGKSTIFNAVDYVFGVNDTPATALQSRNTKEPMYAKLEMESNDIPFIISRGKKDGLTVIYGEEKIEGNAKLAEEKIDEIIGVPRAIFKKMLHKKQKEGGFFLQLTAKESYEFLTEALGLQGSEKTIEKIDLDIKEKQKQLQDIITKKNTSDSIIATLTSQLSSIQEVDISPLSELKEKIISLKTKIDELSQTKESIKQAMAKSLSEHALSKPSGSVDTSHIKQEISQLEQKKKQFLDANRVQINAVQVKISELSKELSAIQALEKENTNAKTDCQRLLVEKQSLDAMKCPMCTQLWHDDKAKQKAVDIINRLKKNKEIILSNQELISQKQQQTSVIPSLNLELQSLQSNYPTDIETEIKQLNAREQEILSAQNSLVSGFYAKQRSIESEYNNQIYNIEVEINSHTKEVDALSNNVRSTLDKKKNSEELKVNLSNNIKDLQDKNIVLEQEITQYNKYISVAEESKRAVKAFNLSIFQETLQEIGDYASNILSSIPNMANASISFQTSKETKSGKVKEEINAMLSLDGEEDVNIKTLSGGERTACDLAVDLAVIDVLEAKANKGIDLFILDEPFTGLEEQNIEKCLNIICTVDTNKKILIVDHNPVVKQMVYGSINIERQGDTSRIIYE
jgi:DNA repair exonuclease SbcCD ATPase subunit